jgi:hypothetical protein
VALWQSHNLEEIEVMTNYETPEMSGHFYIAIYVDGFFHVTSKKCNSYLI